MSHKTKISPIGSALKQAGIDSTEFTTDSLTINELPSLYVARLRCFADTRPEGIPNLELPQETGTCRGKEPAILCLRPAEWLFVCESESSMKQASQSIPGTLGNNAFWSDISDGMTAFRLSGQGAAWLLNKVSGLDFQSGIQAGDHCTRTRIGQVATVIYFHHLNEDKPVFDLILDRSIARYLWDLLRASAPHADDLAREQGVAA